VVVSDNSMPYGSNTHSSSGRHLLRCPNSLFGWLDYLDNRRVASCDVGFDAVCSTICVAIGVCLVR
jgi:hypothetical protein